MGKIENKLITVVEARKLQANWNNNQGKGIKDRGLKDVREFLFDLEDLQEYINFVRSKSQEQGIENPGIRIYFGAYPPAQQKVSTVFLAPTMSIMAEEEETKTVNNYEIPPINTVKGGYPPTDY